MGRAFEFRKARKFKRWDKMSKAFTRLGKEIVMAVKEAGPNPETNSRLRTAMNNAKGVNMPKDRVEAAIKRASSKEEKDYEEVVYEGYGPHGIAILVETATDNINRTIANMRVYFSRAGGAVGKTGSLDFIFTRKGIFKINPEGVDIEELELELIDFGADDIYEHEGEIIVETAFADFGQMQKALEEKGLNVISAELQRIPNTRTELTDEQAEEIENLVEKIEEDDDVQAVYHNMA
ncbi:YebC/PmpR family DNA-binding transcriptional regulator [Pontibacter fetidus]|uniref:Probable transcriptional regulatory protein GWO68_09795 n=1 Tax=Pontibacter fetidus TaxID=2700082 RepID=A0A6B2H268_9BACT|nr:YebC/PmpR family DNA-binding transcriptional regulator [Pontibacter fetidus]NDK56208.1 YebC/PmpR family DNA-binding transcriptional regulator [Pontibacter fetidus]